MRFMYFVSKKGRKSTATWTKVATPKSLAAMLRAHPNDPQVADAVAEIQKCALVDIQMIHDSHLHFAGAQLHANNERVHAVLVPNFTVGLGHFGFQTRFLRTTEAQWLLHQPTQALVSALVFLEGKKTSKTEAIVLPSAVAATRGKLDKGGLTVKIFEAVRDFARTETVALFSRLQDGAEGYIDSHDRLGTLDTAQLYSSVEEAQQAAENMGGFAEVQVVRLDLKVVGLGPLLKVGGSYAAPTEMANSSIYAVAADLQNEALAAAVVEHTAHMDIHSVAKTRKL